jgi:hypothetical protein
MSRKKAAALDWKIERVPTRPGSRRAFVFKVTCPEPPMELTWDNDFGRGARCGCRRFPSKGKAERYVDSMKGTPCPAP